MDLAWIKVGWANPMSAKARRILASSKCEKEPKVVPDSTRDSSAIFEDMSGPRREGVDANGTEESEVVVKTAFGDFRRKLCSRSLPPASPQPRATEMYPYTQLHLGGIRSVAVAGPHFHVLGSGYVLPLLMDVV